MIQNGNPVNLIWREIENTFDQYQKRIFIPLTYFGNETIIMSNKIQTKIEGTLFCSEMVFGFNKRIDIIKTVDE